MKRYVAVLFGTISVIVLYFVGGASVSLAGVPDTGQAKCYNNSGEITCPQPGEDFYGQDANYIINRPSYTRLDANGTDLKDSETEWSMVRDNVTGLIWEVKQAKDGTPNYSNPNDADNIYTWYDSKTDTGNRGTPGDGTDTEDFISSLNSQNFGEYSDWRLPTIKELLSIVNLQISEPAIISEYFINLNSSSSDFYWSSDTNANETGYAWCANFRNGYDVATYNNTGDKSKKRYTIAVRGDQNWSLNNFIDNNDGTITDMYDPAVDINFFPGTASSAYWSSTTPASAFNRAWLIDFSDGKDGGSNGDKSESRYFRAVRGGQNESLFQEFQSIPTLNAANWESFTIDGDNYLVVANKHNAGNYEINSKIYKWDGDSFEEFQALATSCAFDWEYFTIGTDHYLVVANHRNNSGSTLDSKIYKWNGTSFAEFQSITTYKAFDWEFFTIGTDHFLVVTNHIYYTHIIDSKIYKWNGTKFEEFQSILTSGATDWEFFTIDNDHYLAVANTRDDHTLSIDSKIYKWNGTNFTEFQSVLTVAASDWEFFTIGNNHYLAVANFRDEEDGKPVYNINSKIYKWNGTSFVEFQSVPTNGAQDWEFFTIGSDYYLALVNQYNSTDYINSKIYKWDGAYFMEFQLIPTQTAIDWEFFTIGSDNYLAVATGNNSKIYKSVTQDDGLIAYYPFNGNANDETGNGHDADIVNGVTLTEDRFGNPGSAYSFNGRDAYISVPDSEALRLNNTDFTLSAWIYETNRNETLGDAILFKRELGDEEEENTGWGFSVIGKAYKYPEDVGKLMFDLSSGASSSYIKSSHSISLNVFHHVAVVYNMDDKIAKIYIDGSLDATKTHMPPPDMCTNRLFIGKDSPTLTDSGLKDNGYYFHGIIDDIGIYNRALSESEIQSLYNERDEKNDRFQEFQSVPITGMSFEWEFFTIGNDSYIAVANYSNNNSYNDTPSKIFKWNGTGFAELQTILTNGAVDWEFFTIGDKHYLAVANYVKGDKDDKDSEIDSLIYVWQETSNSFEFFRNIKTYGARDWEFFTINNEHYLAVANHIDSMIYKWNGNDFAEFQPLQTKGGADWEFFTIDNGYYLAVANEGSDGFTYNVDSKIYKWNGSVFKEFQSVPTIGARDCEFFTIDGEHYLAIAYLWDGSLYNLDSKIYKWNGGEFEEFQSVPTVGALDWEFFIIDGECYLAVAHRYHYDGSSHDIDSKIYKWNGINFAEFESISTNGASDWEFFTIDGNSYLGVANFGVDKPDKVYSITGVLKKKKAIIVAGTDSDDLTKDNIWKAIELSIEYAYTALLSQGYTKENIYLLSPESNLDLDGNSIKDDVDGESTHANLKYAIETWASEADELLFYMVDHGEFGTFRINANEILKAEDLDEYLDTLQMSMPGRLIFVYDACNSGSFISLLKPPPGKERIVITSSGQDQSAYFLDNGKISFSHQFWSIIFKRTPVNSHNLADAYSSAEELMDYITETPYKQLALTDANGNGIAEPDDKLLLRKIVIGYGLPAAADVPNIAEVCESQILYGETSSTLWARVIDSDISTVWAIITPPYFAPGPSDTPIINLPLLELTDPDKDGIYDGVYENFTSKGIYKIAFHAIDEKGLHSPPAEKITVEQTIPIPGDINNDGFVNLDDAISILKILAGIIENNNITPDTDINKDEKIGMEEILYILQKIAELKD